MKKQKTERGFSFYEFQDIANQKCSLQKSSSVSNRAIWLGLDEPRLNPMTMTYTARMHLNKEMAKEIVKILNKFIETGEI